MKRVGDAVAPAPAAAPQDAWPICPLCERPILPEVPQNRHHLLPKLKGGAGGPTVLMHRMCHDEIHAVLSEAELARAYTTVAALRAHPHLARFARWLRGRPLRFHARTQKSRRRG
ncbi:MAG: HNH endonuclease [Pseudomonadota bacterium]